LFALRVVISGQYCLKRVCQTRREAQKAQVEIRGMADCNGDRVEKFDRLCFFFFFANVTPSRVYSIRIRRLCRVMPRDAAHDCCRVGKAFPHVRRCGTAARRGAS